MAILDRFTFPIRLKSLPERPRVVPPDAPPKWRDALLFVPNRAFEDAVELALALRQPLLLTGEPGCGKTTAAYWVAWRLGLAPQQVLHASVQSGASAARFRYEFDIIRYFRDAQLAALHKEERPTDWDSLIHKGTLWRAYERARHEPIVLLVDELDKAPRDFPNDLLRDFEEHAFEVPDLPLQEGRVPRVQAPQLSPEAASDPLAPGLRLVVCTSNGERTLPGAFLRRCVHHHMAFDRTWLREIVTDLSRRGELRLAEGLRDLALERFLQLRALPELAHRPGTGELLVWLRVLEALEDLSESHLRSVSFRDLPYLGALLKDPTDLQRLPERRSS